VFADRALGERIVFPFYEGRPAWEIVGVVGDEQFDALDRDVRPTVYFPYAQTPDNGFTLVVRTAGDPLAAIAPARQEVAAIDRDLPLFAVQTMEQVVGQSNAVFRRRAVLVMVGLFAAAAVLLSAIGLYGVVAQTVVDRTKEIGVRVALGADRARILGLVVKQGATPAVVGIAAGAFASVAFARALRSLLFGVGAADPRTLALVIAILAGVAATACLVPAARSLRINPVEALRRD
jgi:putative ABC transport system permease protein